MKRSIVAVGLGVLLALGLGLMLVGGVLAPVFTRIFGLERVGSAVVPLILLAFAAAFAFYFGGMAAAYKAPGRHRLHGTLVAPVAFVISPTVNLLLGRGPFPGLDSLGTALLVAVFLAVCSAAAYVGSRRGATLHAHNEGAARRRRKQSNARRNA